MNVSTHTQTIATNALLLHGFTGDPSDVKPVTDMLVQHGWNCHAPTLPGHEDGFSNIGNVEWADWRRKVEEEAEQCTRLYGKFSIIGFSMGCLLAAYAANRYPVERVVLLNAPVIYFSPKRYVEFFWEKFRKRDFSHFTRAAKVPHRAVLQFIRMAGRLRKEFHRLRQPSLICQSGRDQIIHPRSADYLMRVIPGEKRLVVFPRSRHVICWDVEVDELLQEIKEFLLN